MSRIVPHNWGKIVLSIIIVNYNGKKIIESCIESIKEYLSVPYEIIIVDNASTDGSQKYITHKFPDINLISNRENEGFAKGNNIGVQHSKGKYILLLNNDAYLSQDMKPLIDLMESDRKIGVAGIKMYGKENEYRYSAGFFPVAWRLFKISTLYVKRDGFKEGKFIDIENSSSPYYEVDWVEGSFMLTRSSLWNLVGGLDEWDRGFNSRPFSGIFSRPMSRVSAQPLIF
jgi:GT2 family glycosyltransferase